MMKHLLLIVLSGLFFIQPISAEYFSIRKYNVDVQISEEGYADFEETIVVEFTQPRHGFFRFIPYRNTVNGKTNDFFLENIDVVGYKFSKSKENNNVVLRIGDPDTYVDGRQTYRIKYRVLNPIFFFDELDEFNWDLMGHHWEVSTDEFTFKVTFPSTFILDPYKVDGRMGAYGSRDTVALQINQHSISGSAGRRLMPGEGVTVAAAIPKGVFKAMDPLTSLWLKHALLLPAFLFVIVGMIAKFIARNKRQVIMTEYFPPEGVSPAVAGGFVDHSVDSNDVLSLIPHLANHGYLRMEAVEGKGLFSKDDVIFHKLKEAGPDLMHFERIFFDALFSTGTRVSLQSLKDRFYPHMATVKTSVHDWIRSQGWYEADQKAFGCIVGILGLISLAWGAYALFVKQNINGIGLGIAGIILFVFANKFNKRSPAGNESYRKMEGFRRFVEKAERPVIERLMKDDPLYYDKTMPFALAFGYLKQWNRQFEGLLTQPPSWYTGPHMYAGDMTRSWSTFSEKFPSEINNIGSVFSSSPSSSGSGSGGGGGFSGGGGGGGGGGSW